MSTLLIFDFDRTLFNLTQFLRDLQHYVWELAPVPDSKLAVSNKTLELFLDPPSYSDEQHMRLWLAPKLLPAADYAYADALELLKGLPPGITPVVVTHGISEHKQYFKRWFAPSLQKLPFYVTDQNKGVVIAERIQRQGDSISVDLPHVKGKFDRVMLIDDNPISFQPLVATSPVEMVHLVRPREPFSAQPSPAGVPSIRSLREFMTAIK